MKILKSENGFTLIEVIISILFLAIISGVVIQLYVASKDLSEKAKESDMAVITASSAIELLEHFDSPFEAFNHEFFDLAISNGFTKDVFSDEQSVNMILYYDKEFQPSIELRGEYMMTIILKKADGSEVTRVSEEAMTQSVLVDIEVSLEKIRTNEILADHQLSHYYTYKR